ncbi:MAG: SDR family oxidoreductase [Bacillota bacterium]|nr:SDR family oxidoreductase [Bacillota bacterium]
MELKGKVAIITGGGSGIGRAASELFAREGARVVVADINREGGEKTASDIAVSGGEAIFVKCDVSDEEDIIKMVDTVVKKFGQINILFNIAGYPQTPAMIEELTVEDWEKVMNINVKSVWMTAKHTVKELRKNKGNIINIGSVGGIRPRPGTSIYSTSKGAIISLTKALAIEFAPDVRVNVINPGPVDTPMLPHFVKEYNEDIKKEIIGGTPLNRLVKPEEIAYEGLHLASDHSSAITGTMINVDCGLFIGGRGKN